MIRDISIEPMRKRRLALRAAGFVVACACAGMPWQAHAQAQEPAPRSQVGVDASGADGFVALSASADIQADRDTVWAVLSDYDHLADFIPDMQSSRVVERGDAGLIVEQKGRFGFLFFRQSVDVRLEVTEQPRQRIAMRAVGGNLKQMQGVYEIQSLPGGAVRLSYSARLLPAFPVPPIVGAMVMRHELRRQFEGLVGEIVRRGVARGKRGAGSN